MRQLNGPLAGALNVESPKSKSIRKCQQRKTRFVKVKMLQIQNPESTSYLHQKIIRFPTTELAYDPTST